ncbi:MAG: M48 family metalloprotease [Phormidesmis sp.]
MKRFKPFLLVVACTIPLAGLLLPTAHAQPSTQPAEDATAKDTPPQLPIPEHQGILIEEDATPQALEVDRIRRKLLVLGDEAYRAGDIETARSLYRRAKSDTWLLPQQLFAALPPMPFSAVEQLSPAGAVYWREAQAGLTSNRPAQRRVALGLLTTEQPAFIPAQIAYATMLQAEDDAEAANQVLEQALTRYPDQPDLLLAQVDLYMAAENWLEAAIVSRQFVALNAEHPQYSAQSELASENLGRFQREMRSDIRKGAIANVFTGALSYALTGSIFGPATAASSAVTLLQGENSIGNQYATQIQNQLPMLEHPEALGYVRGIGNKLAATTGRRDLDYEFFVILDPSLNAFALPGGKIFVNAGAIIDTDSEAELAGLLAHELSHSVLSHGFQQVTRGNLSSSVAQYLPYGGLVNNVFLSGYSRDMERQADIVGTQILDAGGYAADGLHNVMVTLNEQAVEGGPRAPSWIASHPNPEDRVAYLQNLVERGGYDRYGYEGVVSHEQIQAIVARELMAYEAQRRKEFEIEDNTHPEVTSETNPEATTNPEANSEDDAE